MTQTLNIGKGIANQQPYAGAPYNIPVSICIPTKSAPTIASIQVQWATYNNNGALADAGVFVNLTGQSVSAGIIDSIRSIYIDNTQSGLNGVPVTVYFPDTSFSVTCKPNAQGWFPVNTNALQALIIGNGFNSAAFNLNTLVLFANFNMPPYENSQIDTAIARWLASAAISRGSTIFNQNFGVPALGDQIINYFDLPPTGSNPVLHTLWGTPLASGFIYLTHIDASAIWNAGSSPGTIYQWTLESTGSAGTLFTWQAPCIQGTMQSQTRLSGMNVKLDATQTWRLRSINSTALPSQSMQLNHTFCWTTNPS